MEKVLSSFLDITIIIPAFRPDHNLTELIQRLSEEKVSDIIIVDDGSGKEYRDIFSSISKLSNCVVLEHAVNLGKGRACKTAINYLVNRDAEALKGCVTTDCYGSFEVDDILRIMKHLYENRETLVLGKRIMDETNMSKAAKAGNKALKLSYHYLIGVDVTDPQTVLRGIPAGYMRKLLTTSGEQYDFDTQMIIGCKKYKVDVKEITLSTEYTKRRNMIPMRTIKDNIPIYITFAVYIFTSMLSSIVDIILFSIFCGIFDNVKELKFASSYVMLATATARLFSATVSYFMNYRLVFKANNSKTKSFSKWVGLCIIQMAISAFTVSFLHNTFGGSEVLFKIPVDFALFFFMYYCSREFIYK